MGYDAMGVSIFIMLNQTSGVSYSVHLPLVEKIKNNISICKFTF